MPPKPSSRETVEFHIPGRLPSWNQILGMSHWERVAFKRQAMDGFLCALRACDSGCSTRTTSARSTLSIAAAMLVSYREMALGKRTSKRTKGSARPVKRSTSRSQSSPLTEVPPTNPTTP